MSVLNTLGINNLAVGDSDGDGDLDVLVACKWGRTPGIRGFSVLAENMGKGEFRIRRRLMEPDETIGVALGIWMETGLSMY